MANREGVFHAYPLDIGVAETGPNNLATATIQFGLVQEKRGNEFVDCSGEALEITGYFYLEKRDGSLNERTIQSLREAFGWDGRDPFWLQDTDLSQHAVQVVLGFETYDGKQRLRVQWLNPYGSEAGGGGVTKGDGAARRALAARLGGKLRAVAGGTPRTAPAPSGKPAMPKPPAPTPAGAAASSTADDCWAAFVKAHDGQGIEQGELERRWFALLDAVAPGKGDALTPAEWAAVMARIDDPPPF